MKNVTISVMAFNVQNKKNEMVDLNKIGGVGISRIFFDYMEENKEKFGSIPRKEKVYKSEISKICDVKDASGRKKFTFMFGKIKTGNYGLPSEIVDPETGVVTYVKTDKEAEVLPFYFSMSIPATGDNEPTFKGILIYQMIGVNSMRTAFEASFEKKIKSIDPNLKLIVGHLAPISYVQKFLDNGLLDKITLTKYYKYDDPASKVQNGFSWEAKELTIKKPTDFVSKKRDPILRFLKGATNLYSIIEVKDFGFEYDTMKFNFTMGGKSKTINLSNLEMLAITEDITDKVVMVAEEPTLESMYDVLMETTEIYMSEIGAV